MRKNAREWMRTVSAISIIILFIFIADRAGGMAMRALHSISEDVTSPKLEYIASGCDEEIVVFGTSRAASHYRCDLLSEILGKRVYNAGIDASKNIYSQYVAIEALLAHHTPETIILDLMESDWKRQEDSFSELGIVAPLFGCSEKGDTVFRLSGKHMLFELSHLYRYNRRSMAIIGGGIRGIVKRMSGRGENYVNNDGFVAAPDGKLSGKIEIIENGDGEEEEDKLMLIRRIAAECKERGIRLIFVVSPRYTEAGPDLYLPLRRIAVEEGIVMLDYHTSGHYHSNPEYFHDHAHLNPAGAEEFSRELGAELLRINEESGMRN